MEQFERESELPVSAETLYDWHMQEGAFERLVPPWQEVEILDRPERLEEGARLVMKMYVAGPVGVKWVAEHRDFVEGRQFVDVQVEGPFRTWRHTHRFEPLDEGRSLLRDSIEYELPMGEVGRLFGGWFARRQLDRMFEYRHRVTRESLVSEGSEEP